ncbi:hypothetical protein X949_2041 [Burkholderia pseudomallei MSHR5609]|nr:hypothetical protein DO73_2972 [Burkholderia pseudomallei]KGS59243.1 hypothetical protein X949_2041 [Burkholderia pseudomallei MSHR5609]
MTNRRDQTERRADGERPANKSFAVRGADACVGIGPLNYCVNILIGNTNF